jgi:hypothetical protein
MSTTNTTPGRERVQDLLPTLQDSLGPLDVRHFVQKVNEQKDIVKTREDARVLNLAISAFTSLQHVQILRVQDQADASLISYIRNHAELNHLVELKWPPGELFVHQGHVKHILILHSMPSQYEDDRCSTSRVQITVLPILIANAQSTKCSRSGE